MKSWYNGFLDILFPRVCRLCEGKLAQHEKYVCEKCKEGLTRTLWHQEENNRMEDIFAGILPIERATALLFYTRGNATAQILQEIKYRGASGLGEEMGKTAMRELFTTGFFSNIDFLMPIPIHFTKKMKRGYNQSEMICRGLASEGQLAISKDLVAVKNHATQTHKSIEQRRKNVAGSYELRNASRYDGKHIMLVDDVCTTGSTLLEAGKVIMAAAPTARLSIFTLAFTQG